MPRPSLHLQYLTLTLKLTVKTVVHGTASFNLWAAVVMIQYYLSSKTLCCSGCKSIQSIIVCSDAACHSTDVDVFIR